jgi:cation-transporting ATPase E
VLLLVARPLEAWKIALVSTMAGLFALCLVVPALRDFFNLDISTRMLLESLAIGAAGAFLTGLIWDAARRRTSA